VAALIVPIQIAASHRDSTGIVRVDGRPRKDVVVWLQVGPDAPRARQHVVLDQRNLTFSPHVLAVQTGTTVRMPNNDRVFHNVFSWRSGI
jgi:plastocyanin